MDIVVIIAVEFSSSVCERKAVGCQM